MGKLLREPVVHFALFGVALFVWFGLVSEPAPAPAPVADQSDEIVISPAGVSRMAEQFKSVWHRNPTEQELAGLVNGAVREEILVREALALGLDRGDAAIRNRLMQKMQFLTESAAQTIVPKDDVLRAFLQDNPDSFETPGKIGFDQVYLGQSTSSDVVDSTLAALVQGTDPQTLGRGGLLPGSLSPSTQRQTDGTFGTGFFEALKGLEPGDWAGPVKSGYGAHLVRVTGVIPAALPDFEQVRDKVLFDWRRSEAKALSETQFEAMKARYVIVTPDDAAMKQALGE